MFITVEARLEKFTFLDVVVVGIPFAMYMYLIFFFFLFRIMFVNFGDDYVSF